MTSAAGGAGPEGLTVSHSHDPARLASLRSEWTELFDAAKDPSPFLSWEWLQTWWRSFGGRRRSWILEARDGEGVPAYIVFSDAVLRAMAERSAMPVMIRMNRAADRTTDSVSRGHWRWRDVWMTCMPWL